MTSETYKAKTWYQQEKVAQDYNAKRFTSWHGRIAHQVEIRALSDALDKYCKSSNTILDLPCGTGRLFDAYLNRNAQVTGGDISDAMLGVARAYFENDPRFSFERCDAESLPFSSNHFDCLVSYRLFCHLPFEARRTVLAEMIRVTREILIINYYFQSKTPLYFFNHTFRKSLFPPYPLREKDFYQEIEGMNVELREIKKLSWYERSSALVILQKNS